MAVRFTPEQQRVIDLQGSSILVSAAAGSGKTAVLVERIVKKVCDGENPVDIDRLLIVTFTNAAAAQMRERIGAGIAARLAREPESEHIQRQATLLHNAQITTIDSFCLFLLRNHFNEIGLDPAFRIADEGEVRLMREETLGELIEDSYASGEESFRRCVEYFCPGSRESALEQHVLELSRYADSYPWPSEWLEERKRDYDLEDEQAIEASDCGRYLMRHLQAMSRGWIRRMKRIQKICQEPDGPYMYGETVDGELEQLERLEHCGSLAEYAALLPAVSFGRLSSRRDESVSAAKRELAGNLRAALKKSVKGLGDSLFATPLSLAAEQGLECREPVSALIDLVLEFRRRMAEKKREKKVIDFSDMEHFALEVLLGREDGKIRPSRVALEYRQYFEEVLIDEYQDSNLVQEYLLGAISGEEEGRFNRFMVGDVKQSIYKFRLARPELFLEKYHSYVPCPLSQEAVSAVSQAHADGPCMYGETVDGELEQLERLERRGSPAEYGALPQACAPENCPRVRIDLSRNFRSRTQVIEAVNQVFSRLMSRETGGIEYDDRAALYPGAVYPENSGNESELLLIEKPPKESEITEKQAEAAAVAKKIKELRETFSVTDRAGGELRPLRYADIVILLRTNSGWDEVFREVLEKEGIPVYITSRTGYFGASEVQELLQLLRVLDNPRQDIPLFGVMRSIFGGFTDEEIALIRSQNKNCTLYEAAVRFAQENENGLKEVAGTEQVREEKKLMGQESPERERESGISPESLKMLRRKTAGFLDVIRKYRQCTVYLPVRELLTKLVTDFDYLNYVTALPAGGKRRANVEMLFARASDFEKTSYFGLFHFVRYMEQLEKYDVDYGEAELLDENADVVRIMSIHKSKGLEFPVTFVSGLSKRFNLQDVNRSLILDVDLGLATDYVNLKKRLRNKTLRRNILARKLREDSLSEELRVLYVAMTRAREKLILTATLEKAAERWEAMRETPAAALDYPDFMESSGYLDFLLPVIGETSFRVSVLGEEDLAVAEWKEQFALYDRRQLLEQAAETEELPALENLRQRLHRKYAYEDLAGLYTKTTVSELKIAAMADRDEAAFHAFEEKEIQPYIPSFRREEEKVSGTVRGNAYHRVMELMDFPFVMGGSEEGMPERLRQFLSRETEERRLKQEYAGAVSERRLLSFLRSGLARRMLRAAETGKLYREQPFVMGVSASRLGEQFPESENVLIQGIIDVFFEEEDGLVLLDYKTDAVLSMQELWNRYQTQLDYYGEALQRLMGRPVKEKILYSFHLSS